MWLDLHSVQRDKGFERVQGTMHVPGAWPQDWGAPCLFHVLSKGKGSGVLAVLLLVLPCYRLQRPWEGRSDPPEAVAPVLEVCATHGIPTVLQSPRRSPTQSSVADTVGAE